MLDPRTHIAEIRSIKYWLDENGQSKGKNPLATDLQDSIRHLAEGLYSKNIHFIFELIQNAEDNAYKTKEPSLSFRLAKTDPTGTMDSDGALIVQNNESGFSADNIDAICAVGKTTKSKIQGYIGEKGIGFKSVFRVTSNPHIFSNGYAFCLSEQDAETGLGYIVPQWIDHIPEGIDQSQTTIILPLNKKDFNYEQIEKMLWDIEPETILFLSKIKEISIETDSGDSLTILKDDHDIPNVQIMLEGTIQGESLSKVDEFLLYTDTFEKPPDVLHEKRMGITQRDVSIALPLNDDSTSVGKIFAYLPIRSDTGLPFLINADLILTSSREDILKDLSWNQWLLDCVSDVFIEAFEKWLDIEKYRALIFGFIPLEANSDYLLPVVNSIREKMKNRDIVPTEPDGKQLRPDKVKMASKEFRSLLSPLVFPEPLLDTRIVLGELEMFKKQLEFIGVEGISLRIVKNCFQDIGWISQHDMIWLLECYRYLSRRDFAKLGLTDCPIVPVETERSVRWSCDNEQPIYFERDDECRRILDTLPESVRIPLAFLDGDLFTRIKPDEKICKWMTDALRVYTFSKNNYSTEVLEWLKKNYNSISEPEIASTTVFLSHFIDIDFDFKDIPVVLADGRRMLLSEVTSLRGIQMTVTPATLDIEMGWQNIWKTGEDRKHFASLSSCYPRDACEFLIKKRLINAYPKPFVVGEDDFSAFSNKYVDDYLPPEWMKDCRYNISLQESNSLLSLLKTYSNDVKNWHYRHYSRPDGRYNFSCREYREATFLQCLKKLKWLPTTKGLAYPNQAFLPSPDIKDILGDAVPYFEGDLPDSVLELLGIKTKATAEELVSILEGHAQNGSGSKELVERIYRILASRELHKDIIKRLQEADMVFAFRDSRWIWLNYKDVVWKDRKDVLGDDFIFLENTYPKLKEFFVDTVGVKADVDTEVFARRWLKLQKESDKSSRDIEEILAGIYREIRPVLIDGKLPEWWHGFASQANVWTQKKTFDDPRSAYIPDDGDLESIFERNNTAFVWWPEKDSFPDWENIYKAIGVRYLSESVRSSLNDNIEDVESEQAQFLTDPAKILISTWIKQHHPLVFQTLVEDSTINALLNTQEKHTASISVRYQLEGTYVDTGSNCFWDKKSEILYVAGGSGGRIKNAIARTVAINIMPNRLYKKLADWIELVLSEDDYKWRIEQNRWGVPIELAEFARCFDANGSFGNTKEVQRKNNLPGIGQPNDKQRVDTISSGNGEDDLLQEKTAGEKKIDFPSELEKVFKRPGKTQVEDKTQDGFGSRDPGQRIDKERDRQVERIEEEPDPEQRRRETMHRILEGPDEEVRATFVEWYGGKCQICGSTFPERNGRPFFIAKYIVERRSARQVDTRANALCLCAEHFAKWQHGAVEANDISAQIDSLKIASEDVDENLQLRVRICGEDCTITFHEKHVLALRGLMDAYNVNE